MMLNNYINRIITVLERIDSRLSLIEKQIEPLNRNSKQLWTVRQIAGYLQFSYEYVLSHIITLEDFPKPITHKTNEGKAYRRYIAGEVIRYFEDKARTKQTKAIKSTVQPLDIEALRQQARVNAVKALRGFRV